MSKGLTVTEEKIELEPPNWCISRGKIGNGYAYWGVRGKGHGLAIIISIDTREDEDWIHVSVSRKSRVPSYEDLCLVKQDFIGDDREAYQKFPKASEHVNTHPYCLHLWSPLDGRKVTPDFRIAGEI